MKKEVTEVTVEEVGDSPMHDFRNVLRPRSSSPPATSSPQETDFRGLLRSPHEDPAKSSESLHDFHSVLSKPSMPQVRSVSPHDFRSTLKKPDILIEEEQTAAESSDFRSLLHKSGPTKVDTFKLVRAEQKDFRGVLKKTEASVEAIRKSESGNIDFRSMLKNSPRDDPIQAKLPVEKSETESESSESSECNSVIESKDFKGSERDIKADDEDDATDTCEDEELALSAQPLIQFDTKPIDFSQIFGHRKSVGDGVDEIKEDIKEDESKQSEQELDMPAEDKDVVQDSDSDDSDGSFVVHDDLDESDIPNEPTEPLLEASEPLEELSDDIKHAISTSRVTELKPTLKFSPLRRLSGRDRGSDDLDDTEVCML